jgi:hypothetical protein
VLLDAVGTVIWAKETRQGIQFTNVTPKIEQSIREFISEVEE